MFGGAVAAGIVAVSPVEALVTAYSPTHTLIGKLGKGVEHRVMEITCGSAAAYALNRFVIKNEYTNRDLLYKLAIVAVADIVGETLCEVMMLH